jgi:hypothetical protein
VAHLGAVQGLEVLALPVVHHIAQQAIILEHDRVPDGPPLPDLGAQGRGRGRLLAGDGARGDDVGDDGVATLEVARHEALEVAGGRLDVARLERGRRGRAGRGGLRSVWGDALRLGGRAASLGADAAATVGPVGGQAPALGQVGPPALLGGVLGGGAVYFCIRCLRVHARLLEMSCTPGDGGSICPQAVAVCSLLLSSYHRAMLSREGEGASGLTFPTRRQSAAKSILRMPQCGCGFQGENAPRSHVPGITVPGSRSVLPLPALRGLGLCSWWSSNVEPYVEPSVSSYVPALRHRPTLPAILPTGSVATRPIPSSVTLYIYTTSRDHV